VAPSIISTSQSSFECCARDQATRSRATGESAIALEDAGFLDAYLYSLPSTLPAHNEIYIHVQAVHPWTRPLSVRGHVRSTLHDSTSMKKAPMTQKKLPANIGSPIKLPKLVRAEGDVGPENKM